MTKDNGAPTDVVPTQTVGSFSLSPSSLEEAMKLAELMARSDLVPKDYQNKPGNVLIAVQMGAEVGLAPMQAIQSICVINGRPTLWGDGLLAVVQAHPDYEWHNEDGSTEEVGLCLMKRKGHDPHLSRFTLADAKRAGLLGKPGPWQTHTKRMLVLRARAFACRDKFADALKGLGSAEEGFDTEIRSVEIKRASEEAQPERETLVEKLKSQLAEPVQVELPSETIAQEPKGDANRFEGYCARMRASKDADGIRAEQKLAAMDGRLSLDQSTVIQDLAVELLGRKKA